MSCSQNQLSAGHRSTVDLVLAGGHMRTHPHALCLVLLLPLICHHGATALSPTDDLQAQARVVVLEVAQVLLAIVPDGPQDDEHAAQVPA